MAELGIELPAVAAPLASYVPSKVTDSIVRSSGQLPFVKGQLSATGRLGGGVSIEEGRQAARVCVLNALAAVAEAAGGIDNIDSIVHVTGYVASDSSFFDQPAVVNGASDVLGEIFGNDGQHTRSAVGVAVLPMNAPVEIEITCRLTS
nr:RidA family protein [Flaviflexus huanghaiensis]